MNEQSMATANPPEEQIVAPQTSDKEQLATTENKESEKLSSENKEGMTISQQIEEIRNDISAMNERVQGDEELLDSILGQLPEDAGQEIQQKFGSWLQQTVNYNAELWSYLDSMSEPDTSTAKEYVNRLKKSYSRWRSDLIAAVMNGASKIRQVAQKLSETDLAVSQTQQVNAGENSVVSVDDTTPSAPESYTDRSTADNEKIPQNVKDPESQPTETPADADQNKEKKIEEMVAQKQEDLNERVSAMQSIIKQLPLETLRTMLKEFNSNRLVTLEETSEYPQLKTVYDDESEALKLFTDIVLQKTYAENEKPNDLENAQKKLNEFAEDREDIVVEFDDENDSYNDNSGKQETEISQPKIMRDYPENVKSVTKEMLNYMKAWGKMDINEFNFDPNTGYKYDENLKQKAYADALELLEKFSDDKNKEQPSQASAESAALIDQAADILEDDEEKDEFMEFTENDSITENISNAQNFKDLYRVLKQVGTINSETSGSYDYKDLIKKIDEYKNHSSQFPAAYSTNNRLLQEITRANGLREKVKQLVNFELNNKSGKIN